MISLFNPLIGQNEGGCGLRLSLALILWFSTFPFAAQAQRTAFSPDRMAPLPLRFEPNVGQAEPGVLAQVRGPRQSVAFTRFGARIDLFGGGAEAKHARLEMDWAGSAGAVDTQFEGRLDSVSHYYLGSDPRQWHPDVPNYSRVTLDQVYPGVDVAVYGSEGRLEYDFVLAPGADPRQVRLRIAGARLAQGEDGELVADTEAGAFRMRAPVSYQLDAGRRKAVRSRYALAEDGTVHFEVGEYDRSRTLVIDPVLVFSTLLGGADADIGANLAIDGAGNSYIGGTTYSRNFPTAGAEEPNFSRNLQGLYDGYVAKIRADGAALVYATYLGGDLLDIINAIAVDSRGAVYVAGQTASFNFPLPATAYERLRRGFSDAFVTKLNPNGTLAYSTLFGGGSDENATSLVVDPAFNVYLTGFTSSSDFPTTPNAAQRTYGGGQSDSFALKFDQLGQVLEWSTYVGGNGEEEISRLPSSDLPQIGFISSFVIARNAEGAIWLAGSTSSAAMPGEIGTAGRTYAGGSTDVYLFRLSADGSKFEFMTYLGGAGFDYLSSMALDAQGNPHLAGFTFSRNFPVTETALQGRFSGGDTDGFLTRIRADNGTVDYSSYFGGQGVDFLGDLTVGSNGDIYLAGSSNSSNFVVTADAFDPGPPRGVRPFLAALNAAGTTRLTAGFFGGPDANAIRNVRLDGEGNIVISGTARGPGFTTTVNSYGPNYKGGPYDTFLAKFAKLGGPGGTGQPVPGACSYTLDPSLLDLGGDPVVAPVTVLTGPECAWTASGALAWASLTGAAERRGPGIVYLSVTANPGGPRAGTVTIAGREVTIRQSRREAATASAPTPLVSTAAGSGRKGVGGDNGFATRAEFAAISGIALDNRGSLYIADPETHVIRRVRPDGIIQPFAGIAANGFTGDGGPASRARLNEPLGLAADTDGNLYIADKGNRRVRRISVDGVISTVAGNGQSGSDGDGGPALQASFREPSQLAFDAAGNLYVADSAANRIRRIGKDGVISTVAGSGAAGFGGDGGPATAARLTSPGGMAFDRDGNLYFADQLNHRIRRITTRGVIETIAGTGVAAWEGDNLPAAGAAFNSPFGVAFDSAGNLYVTDRENHRIRVIDGKGVIRTFAGSGASFFGEEVAPANSFWNLPATIAADPAGNLVIVDSGNLRVRRIRFPLPLPPATAIRSILNGFGAQAVVAGFSIASIFGDNFLAETITADAAMAEGKLPTELGGVRVRFNNRDAYLLFVSKNQINFLVPVDLATGPVPVEVSGPNGRGSAMAFLQEVSPALLTHVVSEQTTPVAVFAGESILVAPAGSIADRESRSGKAGDLVDLIATGLGLTDPAAPEGVVFETAYPLADPSRLAVTIDDKASQVEYVAMTSPGVFLVRVRIPEEVGSGFKRVRLSVRGIAAQEGLAISLE
ncbi:MAG: SBBP repeat-containing protein [Bryobacteraceae bacterium]